MVPVHIRHDGVMGEGPPLHVRFENGMRFTLIGGESCRGVAGRVLLSDEPLPPPAGEVLNAIETLDAEVF